jgi:serine/threonine protein kinase
MADSEADKPPMPVPTTSGDFLALIRKSGVIDQDLLDPFERRLSTTRISTSQPQQLAVAMVKEGLLSNFQASHLLRGKWRNFILCGKYKILEQLGTGGMGHVLLCEHMRMHKLVAVKILPTDKSADDMLVKRFTREARAAGALNHPNIVRAFDIDDEKKFHFIVMEYVDGASLHDIVAKFGPLPIARACHYIRQAALGLQHAHEHGLVHRDIKPANLLLDRGGLVKVHDLGLARVMHDSKITERVGGHHPLIGTADYLAPEQAHDSHNVDIRADIYGLGGTFYFLLTGRCPFPDGTVAQKLLLHQQREPDSICKLRPDIPPEIESIVQRMLAKHPRDRYQEPLEVAEALEFWTREPIPPPAESELPRRSRAVRRIETPATPLPATLRAITPASVPSPTPIPNKLWAGRHKPLSGLMAAILVGLIGAAGLYGAAWLLRGPKSSHPSIPHVEPDQNGQQN